MSTIVFQVTCFIIYYASTEARNVVTEYYSTDNKICYKCSPGTFWTADCKDDLSESECSPCPQGTFQSTYNIAHRCEECIVCENIVKNYLLSRTLMNCTADTNTKCACLDGYYFEKVYGSANEWLCKTISVCGQGYEVIHKATNFRDTVCQECGRGYYKESLSSEPCQLCSTGCDNGTHIISPCNATQDTVCSQVKENVNDGAMGRNNRVDIIILIACSIVGGLCVVFTILCLYVWIFRKRTIKKETNSEPSISTYVDGPSDDDTTSDEIQYDWMQSYRTTAENEFDWTGLFQECTSKPEIIDQWEHFTRMLCINSSQSSKADQIIVETTRAYDQTRIKDRVYNALKSWKEKCYSVDDEYMFAVFTNSFYEHQGQYMQSLS